MLSNPYPKSEIVRAICHTAASFCSRCYLIILYEAGRGVFAKYKEMHSVLSTFFRAA